GLLDIEIEEIGVGRGCVDQVGEKDTSPVRLVAAGDHWICAGFRPGNAITTRGVAKCIASSVGVEWTHCREIGHNQAIGSLLHTRTGDPAWVPGPGRACHHDWGALAICRASDCRTLVLCPMTAVGRGGQPDMRGEISYAGHSSIEHSVASRCMQHGGMANV